jgi:hypothetical protein
LNNPTHCGGIIATDWNGDADNGYSFGIFACRKGTGGIPNGSTSYLRIANMSKCGGDTSEWSNSVVQLESMLDTADGAPVPLLPETSSRLVAYIVTGTTTAQVQSSMQALYGAGYR